MSTFRVDMHFRGDSCLLQSGIVDERVLHRIYRVVLSVQQERRRSDASEFVKKFGGECTHCHKLNKATGASSLPSGPEK